MTITMGSPSPMPVETAGKAVAKNKQNAAPGGADAVSGGFESVLASLDEEIPEESTEETSATVRDAEDQDDQLLVPVIVQPDAEQEKNMLLAGAGLNVKGQATSETGSDSDLAVRDADSLGPLNEKAASPDVANVAFSGSKVKPAGEALHLPQNRLRDTPSDVGARPKGEVASIEESANASARLLKVAKDERAARSQGLFGVSEDVRIKAKEIALEQLQVVTEEVTQSLDLLKNAVAEPAKRVQDLIGTKPSFAETFGSANSEGISYTNAKSLEGTAGLMIAEPVSTEAQVNYWIAGDVQKAELTLDGLGEDPVGVSINVHGKEAEVAFRTDEIQTRELLEASSGKLKDLLSREGMVLTGMSVGSNGSGNPNSQGKNGGQQHRSVKPISGMVSVPIRGESGVRSAGVIGKSLDLFV